MLVQPSLLVAIGHVKLNRVDRRSQMQCLQQCRNLLSNGASVLFFPEGTRSSNKKMADFKKGAFSVAVKASAKIVPVTLIGTGDIMPNGRESHLYPGKVTVIVHPPIDTEGGNPQEICDKAREVIAAASPYETADK